MKCYKTQMWWTRKSKLSSDYSSVLSDWFMWQIWISWGLPAQIFLWFSTNLFQLLCIPKYEMHVLLAGWLPCCQMWRVFRKWLSSCYCLRMDHITKVRTACLCLICSCHGVHDVLGGWVRARCSCSGRPSPPSPTCPGASQTGSYTHGQCFSSPPELILKLKIHSTTSARRTKILWSFSSLVPRPSVASNSSSA